MEKLWEPLEPLKIKKRAMLMNMETEETTGGVATQRLSSPTGWFGLRGQQIRRAPFCDVLTL